MLARFVRDQCLFILRIFNADMDWVEGANFLDTSDFLPLRRVPVLSPLADCYIPPFFRAEWLVHYFLIFGLKAGAAPVSLFLTDPDVTASYSDVWSCPTIAPSTRDHHPGVAVIYIY